MTENYKTNWFRNMHRLLSIWIYGELDDKLNSDERDIYFEEEGED